MPLQRFPTYKRLNPVEALLYLRSYFTTLINDYFDGDRELTEFVEKRFEGAEEIIRNRPGSVYIRQDYLVADIVAAKDTKHPKPSTVRLRDLFGRVVEKRKEPETYRVTVGKYSMKCGCPDATRTVGLANRYLKLALSSAGYVRVRNPPDPSKYVICKHTLAVLALGVSQGVIGIDKEFEKTALMALLLTYISLGGADRRVIGRVTRILNIR